MPIHKTTQEAELKLKGEFTKQSVNAHKSSNLYVSMGLYM